MLWDSKRENRMDSCQTDTMVFMYKCLCNHIRSPSVVFMLKSMRKSRFSIPRFKHFLCIVLHSSLPFLFLFLLSLSLSASVCLFIIFSQSFTHRCLSSDTIFRRLISNRLRSLIVLLDRFLLDWDQSMMLKEG